jgi:fucose permease
MNQKSTIKVLTFLMFMMFGMTTESVGVIIPKIIEEFHLTALFTTHP